MTTKKSNSLLADIKNKLISAHPRGYILNNNDGNQVTDWISTGNYNLNMAISGSFFGGIPNNTITALAGDSGVGKTYLLMNIYRNAIKKGYTVYHFDTEGAVNKDMLENFGLAKYLNEEFILIPVGIIEDLMHLVHQIIDPISDIANQTKNQKDLPKVFMGLDSLGNLASRKEFDDSSKGEEKTDMTAAKKVNSFFRQITEPCSTLKIPFVVTNHIYMTQSFIPEAKLKKGNALLYSASNIILMRKAQLKEKTEKVGILVSAVPFKNRFVRPILVKFHINYTRGMNRFVGLEEYIQNPDQWNCNYEDIGIGMGKLDKDGNFVKSKTNRGYYIGHLEKTVKKASEFYHSQVFTSDVLKKIESQVKPFYAYAKSTLDDTNEDLELMNTKNE